MDASEATRHLADVVEGANLDLRVLSGLGRVVIPPAVVVGPPLLTWEGVCEGPTSARWSVYVVTSMTEFATDQLLALVPVVGQAIERESRAVVNTATPGIYPAAQSGELPAYVLDVEMELTE